MPQHGRQPGVGVRGLAAAAPRAVRGAVGRGPRVGRAGRLRPRGPGAAVAAARRAAAPRQAGRLSGFRQARPVPGPV